MPFNDSASASYTSVSARVERHRAGDQQQDSDGREDANAYGGASGGESAGEADFSSSKEGEKRSEHTSNIYSNAPSVGAAAAEDTTAATTAATTVSGAAAASSGSSRSEIKGDASSKRPPSNPSPNAGKSWKRRRPRKFGAATVDAIKKNMQSGGAGYEADTSETAADRRSGATAAAAAAPSTVASCSPSTATLIGSAAHISSMRHSASLPMFRDGASSGAVGGSELSDAPRPVVNAPVLTKGLFQSNPSQMRAVPLRATYVSAATATRDGVPRGASPLKTNSPQVRFLPKSASCVALPQHLHSLRGAPGADNAVYIASHIPITPRSFAGGTGSYTGTPLMMNSGMGRNGRVASGSVASSMQVSTPLPTSYAIRSIVDIAPFYEYAIQQLILECEHRNTRGACCGSACTTAPAPSAATAYWQSCADASASSPMSKGLGGSVALPRDATPVSGVRRVCGLEASTQKSLQKSCFSASRAEENAGGAARASVSSATSPVRRGDAGSYRGSVVSTHSFDTPIQFSQPPMQPSLSSPIFFSPTSCGSLSLSAGANIAPAMSLKDAPRANALASDSTPNYFRAIPQRLTQQQQQQQPALYSMDRSFLPEKAGSNSRAGSALGMPFSDHDSAASVQRLIENLAHRVPYGSAAPMVFIAALIYLSRITLRGDTTDDTMLTSLNWPRLTTIAVLVASKMYIDQIHKLNKKFAEAQGMSVASVCKLELDFLYLIDFDLFIDEEEVEHWADWMEGIACRNNMVTPLKMFIMGKPSSLMTTPQTSHQPQFSRSGSVHGLNNQMFSLQHHLGNPEGTPSTPFSWSMGMIPLEAGLASPGASNSRTNRAPNSVMNHPQPYMRHPNRIAGGGGQELRDPIRNLDDADASDFEDGREASSRTRFASSSGRNQLQQQHYDPAANDSNANGNYITDTAPVSAATVALSPFPTAAMLPNCNFALADMQRSAPATPSTLSPHATAAAVSTAQSTPIVLIRGWQQPVHGVSLAASTSENGTDQHQNPSQPQRVTPCAHPMAFTPPSAGASHTPTAPNSGTLPHVPVVPPLQATPLLHGRYSDSLSYGQLPLSTALGQQSWNASPIFSSPMQLRFPLYAAKDSRVCGPHCKHQRQGKEKERRHIDRSQADPQWDAREVSSGESDADSDLSDTKSECSCVDDCRERKRLFIIVHAPKEPDTPDSMRGRRGPAPPDLSPLRPPSRGGDSPLSFFKKPPPSRRKPHGMDGCSSASSAVNAYVPVMPVLQRPHMNAVEGASQDRGTATPTTGATLPLTQHGQDSSSSANRGISSQSSTSSKVGPRLAPRQAAHNASHRTLDRLIGNRLRCPDESETSVMSSNHSATDETDQDKRMRISRGLGADVNPRRGSSASESEVAGKREEDVGNNNNNNNNNAAKCEDGSGGSSAQHDSSDSSPASNGSDDRLRNGTTTSDAPGVKNRQITDCGDEQDDDVSANSTANNKRLKLPNASTIMSSSSLTSYPDSNFQVPTTSSTEYTSPPGGGLSTDPSSSARTHSSARHSSWKMESDALSQQSKNTSADTTINDMSVLAKRNAEAEFHKDAREATTSSAHFGGGASDSENESAHCEEEEEGAAGSQKSGSHMTTTGLRSTEERDTEAAESYSTTQSNTFAATHETSSDTGTLPSMLDQRSVGTAPGKTFSACGSLDFSSGGGGGGAKNAPRNHSEVMSVLAELRQMNRGRCSNTSESSHTPAPAPLPAASSAPVALAPIEVEPLMAAAHEAIQCESPTSPSTAGSPEAELSSSNKSRWNIRASLGGMNVVRQVRDVLGATTSLVRGPLNVFSGGSEAPEPVRSQNLRTARVSYDELSYSSVDSSNYYARMPGYPAPPSPPSPPSPVFRRNLSAYATTQACSIDEDYYGNGHRDSFFSNGSYDMCSMDCGQEAGGGAGFGMRGAGGAGVDDDVDPCGALRGRPAGVGGTDTDGKWELCESMEEDNDFEEAHRAAPNSSNSNSNIPCETNGANSSHPTSQFSTHSNHAGLKASQPNFSFPDTWADVSANMSCRSLEDKEDDFDDDYDDDIPEAAIGADGDGDLTAADYYSKCRPTHSPPSL